MPAIGVGHPLSTAAWFSVMFGVVNPCEGLLFESHAVGLGHPVKHATAARSGPWFRMASRRPPSKVLTPLSASAAVGVGHPIRTVTDVRGTDARRRKRDSPEGIFHGFQVSLYKVEPRLRVLACNLLTKEFSRAALADEPGKMWPEMTRVIKPSSFACRGERLARTGTGPNRSIIWPAGAAKGERPDADSREEVALCVVLEVIWVNILDRSFVDVARCYVAGGDQVSKPLSGIWVEFVVVGT